jgi:FtsH-binding integral membrane protein
LNKPSRHAYNYSVHRFASTVQELAMSYAYDPSVPVIHARPNERADFIRRTYLHLAGAILAFVALEAAIFSAFGVNNVAQFVSERFRSPISLLLVMGLFIGAGYLAQYWARSRTSVAMQYAGLGLYVLAEVIIFVPILAFAQLYAPGVIAQAGVLTLFLFGGLTMAAFLTRQDFSFLAPILSIGGWLAIGLIVVAIFMPATVQLGMWFSFLMLGLCAGSILYTTSNMIRHYSLDMHVAAALELFAAIATMFYYILRLLMQMRER